MGKWLFNSVFPGTNLTYKEKLVECVNRRMSGKQISREMGINYTSVHRWLRKLGLNLPNYHNELKFDNTVFDSIDTEEKAYWLGFLYADGYVERCRPLVELSLKGDDIEHLERFRQFLKNRNEVKLGKSKCANKEFARCRLTMVDKHFHDTLIEKGCVPNKSLILAFPDKSIFASEGLILHFIRGYIDGDGNVYKNSSGYSCFQIIGTLEFLTGIKEYFPGVFTNAYHKDKRHLTSNTYFLSVGGKKGAEFGDKLYDNATIFLQRKYDKFIENKYDEREHLRRVYTVSEKKQLYFNRGSNWRRKNLD